MVHAGRDSSPLVVLASTGRLMRSHVDGMGRHLRGFQPVGAECAQGHRPLPQIGGLGSSRGVPGTASARLFGQCLWREALGAPPCALGFYPSWLNGGDGDMEEHLELTLWKSTLSSIH